MEQISLNILKTDYVRFLAKDTAKLFIKFESVPLVEEISGQTVRFTGDKFPFLEKAAFGNGIRMKPRSKISMPLLLQNYSEFSIGFWLRPYWVSPTISPITNLPVYYRMALFDKSNFSYNSSTGFVSSTDGTFAIYEESREEGFNVMKIQLTASDGKQVFVESERYETGKMHHFWISYYGPARRIELHVDGVLGSLFSEDGLAIPQSLFSNSLYFNINNSAIGYSSLLRENAGLLDELLFLNSYVSDSKVIANIINLGAEYFVDKSLFYKDIVNNCFACDDPTSLGVTSVLSNGKNFYAGRSDGTLFKGDREMWQVRRDFANKDEIKFVKKNIFDSDSKVDVNNGALELYKASVRI